MEYAVSVKNLTKCYGAKKAVDNLSFQVKKGTIFGLLGHNGAGKTTTIECILGTKAFENGSVLLLSEYPVHSSAKHRKQLFEKIGAQFQNTAFQLKIKVREICEINASLYKNTYSWKDMLREFHLEDKINSYVDDLSGGERQKLCIILAVMHKPELVFLDELTTGLDPKARREIWRYIKRLRDQGTTIVLTSHYMDEVEYLCDNIVVIKQGRYLVGGTVKEVIELGGGNNMEDAFLNLTGEVIG